MIIFFSPPPRIEKIDGYYARVQEIDQFFENQDRIYIEVTGRFDHFALKSIGNRKWHLKVHREYANTKQFWNLIDESAQLIYFHSIYNFAEILPSAQLVPQDKTVIDIHGAVPEELANLDDNKLALQFREVERIALSRIQKIIVVTNQMKIHLQQKYPILERAHFIFLPTVKKQDQGTVDGKMNIAEKVKPVKNPTILYIGGIQKWQNIELMVDIIKNNAQLDFRIYSADFKIFHKLLRGLNNVTDCRFLSQNEIKNAFRQVQYSLVLRDEHILNRVSCPTKILDSIENLAIPILKSTNIGDFMELGLCYVDIKNIADLHRMESDQLNRMLEQNLKVLSKITNLYAEGKNQLLQLYAGPVVKFNAEIFLVEIKKISGSIIEKYRLTRQNFWNLRLRSMLSLMLAKVMICFRRCSMGKNS